MSDFSHRANRGQRILGIDPGTTVVGWGVVEAMGSSLAHVAHGTIAPPGNKGQAERLSVIFKELRNVFSQFNPHGISLEKIFFARNAQSALKLGQARGVALLSAAEKGLPAYEYASTEIKQAVVGYGRATKEQIQKMVASLLRLDSNIPVDAADALAAAICHLHQTAFQKLVSGAIPLGNVGARR